MSEQSDGKPDVPAYQTNLLRGDQSVATMVLALVLRMMEKPLVFPEAMLDEVAGLGLIIQNAGPQFPGIMVARLVTREEAVEAAAQAPTPDKSKWN
jgi:hypothetical protein